MRTAVDITGVRFLRLVAIRRVDNVKGKAAWLCHCDCGNDVVVRAGSLSSGNTKSCGCYGRSGIPQTKHGGAKQRTRTPEFRAWLSAIQRCCDKNCSRYYNYGARGIHMCDDWRNDFTRFLAHVGPKPDPSMSLDRIDSNGNYEPGNVRWATATTQGRNTRRTKLTMDKARVIRERAAGGEGYRTIAMDYGVNRRTIRDIANLITWKEPLCH